MSVYHNLAVIQQRENMRMMEPGKYLRLVLEEAQRLIREVGALPRSEPLEARDQLEGYSQGV